MVELDDAKARRLLEAVPLNTLDVAQIGVPSGELTFCHGKSPFLMGKSTINGHFQLLC